MQAKPHAAKTKRPALSMMHHLTVSWMNAMQHKHSIQHSAFSPPNNIVLFVVFYDRCSYNQQNIPWLDTYSKVLDVLPKGAYNDLITELPIV